MINFSKFGNDLYTGKRSIPFIEHRRRWYALSAVLVVVALLGLATQKLNLGLEFTGGSEFRVSAGSNIDNYESRVRDAVGQVAPGQAANITKLGTSSSTIRVQTEKLNDAQSDSLRDALAKEFGVDRGQVSASFIGPSWGQSVSQQALRALIVFLALTFVLMAIYFRTWKMSLAAMIAGPLVTRRGFSSSAAMIIARVVFPSPGGPDRSTWSGVLPRRLAASSTRPSWSHTLDCPETSLSRRGRRAASTARSSGSPPASMMRAVASSELSS